MGSVDVQLKFSSHYPVFDLIAVISNFSSSSFIHFFQSLCVCQSLPVFWILIQAMSTFNKQMLSILSSKWLVKWINFCTRPYHSHFWWSRSNGQYLSLCWPSHCWICCMFFIPNMNKSHFGDFLCSECIFACQSGYDLLPLIPKSYHSLLWWVEVHSCHRLVFQWCRYWWSV